MKPINKLSITVLLVFLMLKAGAQGADSPQSAVSIEGSSFYNISSLSINYENTVLKLRSLGGGGGSLRYALRSSMLSFKGNISVGFAMKKVIYNNDASVPLFPYVPVKFNFILGYSKNFFELSSGFSFIVSKRRPPNFDAGFLVYGWPIIDVGYRYESDHSGPMFRAYIGTDGLGGALGWTF